MQLALVELWPPVTRSRCIRVDPETGARGKPKLLAGPAGCVTCSLRHDGGEWTHRHPYELVFDLGGLLYCPLHVDAAVRERQGRRR
jgi:hypothetical protein